MLETICPNCRARYQLGTDHVCPKKSTAARKDVLTNRVEVSGPREASAVTAKQKVEADSSEREHPIPAGRVVESVANSLSQRVTQAPPVDTKLGRPRDTGPSQGKSKRAAQMREYQRQRRERERAAKGKVE